jgi:hypothetical protein
VSKTDIAAVDRALTKAAEDPEIAPLVGYVMDLNALVNMVRGMVAAVTSGRLTEANDLFLRIGQALFGCDDPSCECNAPDIPPDDAA